MAHIRANFLLLVLSGMRLSSIISKFPLRHRRNENFIDDFQPLHSNGLYESSANQTVAFALA